MTTKAKIDKALKDAGIDGEIFRGEGYLYFIGDAFDVCHDTTMILGYRFYNEMQPQEAVSFAKDMIKSAS